MANDNATERVNCALAALRSELSEMRNQDVQLMKQLMNISSSIQQMTKKQKFTKRSKSSRNQRISYRETTLYQISEDTVSTPLESEYESDTASDEEIFRTNVKLWKYSQADDSE